MRQHIGNFARGLVRRLVRIYYPKVEVTGREHLPATGPVLLVANHVNSLIDPVMVGIAARRPVRFFAKAPLFQAPLLGPVLRALGMLPAFRAQDDGAQVRRNLESLNVGARALEAGDTVGIFPEGKSHDSLKLEQIRSGAARMAVQAAVGGAPGIKVVPIGINYQRKQQFRSAVWLRLGEPIDVAAVLARYDGDERKAIRALTAEIELRIKHLALHLDDPVFAPFLDELELLLPPVKRRGHVSISALRQRKRIADAMNFFLKADRPRAEKMAQDIREYRSRLMAAGVSSRSLVMRLRGWKLFLALAAEAAWLAFWFPAAMIGTLFHIVPFVIVRALSRRIEDGPTTTALWRLGLGLPIYGLWYVGAWFALRSYFLPWVAWTITSLMPLAGALALTYAARAREIFGNWAQQMRVLTRPGQLKELRLEQQTLRKELAAFAEAYRREFPEESDEPRPFTWRDRGRIALRWAMILLAAGAVFVWQNWWFKHRANENRYPGLNLAGMPASSLDIALAADETALTNILDGLATLEKRARDLKAEFDSGKRDWYRQDDNDAVRQLLLPYVNYRTALLRMLWKYQDYEAVPDEARRLRAFLVSYTGATTLYATSLKFVTMFEGAPNAIRKLNEPEPLWNIPPGLYDTVRRNLGDVKNQRLLANARARYAEWSDEFTRHALREANPHARLHAAILDAQQTIDRLQLASFRASLAAPLDDASDAGRNALYAAQSFISVWIGDTKIREPRRGETLIRPPQVQELRTKLKPGDVLLERRNWYLSNAFLPGYWPHSALYVGTAEDLRRLGLDRDPRVQPHWPRFTVRDANGHEHVIIESVSEGVVFTSLEHSVGEADSAAFLRPRLPEEKVREAIARAFSHAGKPYDFEFDFFSTDRLVCTELVYRCYDHEIRFPLVEIMGTRTLPAIEIVRKYASERASPARQLDFVAFLDGSESRGTANFADEETFVGTLQRPALTWLQGFTTP